MLAKKPQKKGNNNAKRQGGGGGGGGGKQRSRPARNDAGPYDGGRGRRGGRGGGGGGRGFGGGRGNQGARPFAMQQPQLLQQPMFTGGGFGGAAPGAPLSTGTTVVVTNLASDVTAEDMKELFETVGAVKSSSIHSNEGTAEVVVKSRADAERAIQMYNGRALNDKVMRMFVSG